MSRLPSGYRAPAITGPACVSGRTQRMSWFERLLPSRIRTEGGNKRMFPPGCGSNAPAAGCSVSIEIERNSTSRSYHMRQTARRRLALFLDDGEQHELGAGLSRLTARVRRLQTLSRTGDTGAQEDRGDRRSVVLMGEVHGVPVVASAFGILGGSMGSVVGERFACGRGLPGIQGAAGNVLRERRRAYAGSAVLADADGQDQLVPEPVTRRSNSLYLCSDRPNDGRRLCQPGDAR